MGGNWQKSASFNFLSSAFYKIYFLKDIEIRTWFWRWTIIVVASSYLVHQIESHLISDTSIGWPWMNLLITWNMCWQYTNEKKTKLVDFFNSCDTWEFLKCQNFSQIFRCRVGPSSNAQWIKYWNARFFIKRIFWKISSKTHSQKFWWEIFSRKPHEKFPEGFFGKQLQIFLEGFFFGKQSQIFLEGFFLKQLQIFPEGLFCKTTSNLPWGTFLEKDLISSLRERKKNILASHFRNR